MRSIESKKKVRKQTGEYFESLEAVRAALTETRLALLRLIRERNPKSVAELARIAKRDFNASSARGDRQRRELDASSAAAWIWNAWSRRSRISTRSSSSPRSS
jgi:hypothetical protein